MLSARARDRARRRPLRVVPGEEGDTGEAGEAGVGESREAEGSGIGRGSGKSNSGPPAGPGDAAACRRAPDNMEPTSSSSCFPGAAAVLCMGCGGEGPAWEAMAISFGARLASVWTVVPIQAHGSQEGCQIRQPGPAPGEGWGGRRDGGAQGRVETWARD